VTIIEGAGVVVTGAGAGIGRALAAGLAAAGARVVINDLDADAAAAVAGQTGGYAVPGDVATEPGVRDLIAGAREHLGSIDIYCSNAGIAAGTGPDAPEPDWQRSWDVNLMAHVRASRDLLPACSPCWEPRRTR
jgi:NAD(P)-dependent dehydrogenase (short-subunit alcohol dehydrogenase family)